MTQFIKKYHTWNGQVTSRYHFWMLTLTLIGLGVIAMIIDVGVLGYSLDDPATPIDSIITIVTFYASIVVGKQRLNDAGWSGWWMLFPILNIIVMGFFKTVTKEEGNKYPIIKQ